MTEDLNEIGKEIKIVVSDPKSHFGIVFPIPNSPLVTVNTIYLTGIVCFDKLMMLFFLEFFFGEDDFCKHFFIGLQGINGVVGEINQKGLYIFFFCSMALYSYPVVFYIIGIIDGVVAGLLHHVNGAFKIICRSL